MDDGGAAAPGERRRKAMERSAVALSFWVGGLGLVVLKGVAYLLSGSSLVRAAMFESIGDVFSSAIMAVTQARVADSRDLHLYPVGKRRITALGVLFFAAFATSTMTGLAIQSAQGLFAADEAPDASVGAAAAEAALRHLFAEKPQLRLLLRPGAGRLEEVVSKYAGAGAAAATRQAPDEERTTVFFLLLGCIATKCCCLAWCLYVLHRTDSEIVRTVTRDHRNDVISNSTVVLIMLLAQHLQETHHAAWLARVDPAASLALSLWIASGWLGAAAEQVKVLSDCRAEAETAEAVAAAAARALHGGPLELRASDVYHVGEGHAARLALRLRPGAASGASAVVEALEALDRAVRGAGCEVNEVHTVLAPSTAAAVAGSRLKGAEASWVAGYPPVAR